MIQAVKSKRFFKRFTPANSCNHTYSQAFLIISVPQTTCVKQREQLFIASAIDAPYIEKKELVEQDIRNTKPCPVDQKVSDWGHR